MIHSTSTTTAFIDDSGPEPVAIDVGQYDDPAARDARRQDEELARQEREILRQREERLAFEAGFDGDPNGKPKPKAIPKGIEYGFISSAELAEGDFSHDYLIEGILVAGQPCLIAGVMKTLKTSIGLDLAISLASGKPFLGEFEVTRCCRVAVMSGESGLATIKQTAIRICESKGVELADCNIIWSDKLPLIGDPMHAKAIAQAMADNEIEILFVDPTYRALAVDSKDHSNVVVMGTALASFDEACREVGVQLLLVHHNRKGSGKDMQPPELTDIAWAGFAEWARQWILLGRREKYDPDTATHKLWLEVGGSAGHNLRRAVDVDEGHCHDLWAVSLSLAVEALKDQKTAKESAADRKKESRKKGDRELAMRKIDRHDPKENTKRKWAARCYWNHDKMGQVAADLVERGAVEPIKVAVSNQKKENTEAWFPIGGPNDLF